MNAKKSQCLKKRTQASDEREGERVYLFVCVCVCVCEQERGRERGGGEGDLHDGAILLHQERRSTVEQLFEHSEPLTHQH